MHSWVNNKSNSQLASCKGGTSQLLESATTSNFYFDTWTGKEATVASCFRLCIFWYYARVLQRLFWLNDDNNKINNWLAITCPFVNTMWDCWWCHCPAPLCRFAGGCRVHSREGEEGREEVGRKPIWPWRMEHSDSRSTGLVTQSCIPGDLSELGRGWQGGGA